MITTNHSHKAWTDKGGHVTSSKGATAWARDSLLPRTGIDSRPGILRLRVRCTAGALAASSISTAWGRRPCPSKAAKDPKSKFPTNLQP